MIIGKDLEGTDEDIIKVLSRYFPGGLGKTMRTLSPDTWFPRQDSNPALPEHISQVLLLDQQAHTRTESVKAKHAILHF
jgi:hypothetical protein